MRYGSFIILTLFAIILFFACKKEFSFENGKIAHGQLKKDVTGNCFPISVKGSYISGKSVADSNQLEVTVSVQSEGSYKIYSDTINGFFFKSEGVFKATGIFNVSLQAYGKPIDVKDNIFKIYFDSSYCETTVHVIRDPSIPVPASFTLAGAPAACVNVQLVGSFIKDIPIDSAFALISVDVQVPGIYEITTNTINNYSFSGNGIFTKTGVQTVKLKASGTPLQEETDHFTVRAVTQECSFPVNVLVPLTVTNNDYFPLTDQSFWVYDDLWNKGDSVKRMISGKNTINGLLYTSMDEQVTGSHKTLNFIKPDDRYFENAKVDKYTNSFQFADPIIDSIRFLKEGLVKNETWSSPEYKAAASFGQVLTLQYRFQCMDDHATITVNGKAFSNVYVIKMYPYIKAEGNPYGATGEEYMNYYAKGIGLIYARRMNMQFTTMEIAIRSWKVY